MKDVRRALRTLLLADSTVGGLVDGVRIHYGRLPDDFDKINKPSIVFNKVAEVADYHMAGDSGLGQMRVQVDAWAQSADAATALANAAYEVLSGHRGTVDLGSGEFVNVRGQFMAAGFGDYDALARLYRVSRDYVVWYGASE